MNLPVVINQISTSDLKWYHYHQNNSGGSFDVDADRGIGHNVFIQAASEPEADARAESIGIYFNGVDDGLDCECCGDRWYSPNLIDTNGSIHEYYTDQAYIHPIEGDFFKYVPKPLDTQKQIE